MQSANKDSFLSLVRMGIGHSSALPDVVDWQTIQDLAESQGLMAVVVDGMEQLPDTKRPLKELLLLWIGEVFQSYENRYILYQRAIAELAGCYNAHGYKMMVLKGYACSINWPKPEHRPCGDIDIWLFGKQKESDALLAKEKRIRVDASHHHHTVFDWHGFTVENHYDFVNVHALRSSAELEKVFKRLGEDDSYSVEVMGEASTGSATGSSQVKDNLEPETWSLKPSLRRKARRICRVVVEAGNFGHNKDNSYRSKYPRLVEKSITFSHRLGEYGRLFLIFPADAPRFFVTYVGRRTKAVVECRMNNKDNITL